MFKEITSFEAACKALGKDPAKLPDYSGCDMTEGEIRFNLGVFKFARWATALNRLPDGSLWVPGPDDQRWTVWTIWKKKRGSSGSGLSFDDTDRDYSITTVASRLTFRTEEIAEFAFETAPSMFEDVIIFYP